MPGGHSALCGWLGAHGAVEFVCYCSVSGAVWVEGLFSNPPPRIRTGGWPPTPFMKCVVPCQGLGLGHVIAKRPPLSDFV